MVQNHRWGVCARGTCGSGAKGKGGGSWWVLLLGSLAWDDAGATSLHSMDHR